MIATNTVAQGDSREVGLDAMVASGFTITRAFQSRSWPAASANLEYAVVWGSRGEIAERVPRILDDVAVRRISTLLEPVGRVDGKPARLAENSGTAFIGSYVLWMGFVLEKEEAQEWIAADARNAEVLFPCLNGEDLNSRPDASASRWVIDFGPREEAAAAQYHLPYARVRERVRPERAKLKIAYRRDYWWRFAASAPSMRRAITDLSEVLVIALVSKTVMPIRVRAGQVFSHALGVFATGSYGDQAILSSSLHQLWAITYGSTLETRVRYTPSDVFETFPRPRSSTTRLEEAGRSLDAERRAIMRRRDLRLTKLYNLVHDPHIRGDGDVDRMRAIHVEIDEATMAAFGWDDVRLGHGFDSYRQATRWTLGQSARIEAMDRLLSANHDRHSGSASSDTAASSTESGGPAKTLFG